MFDFVNAGCWCQIYLSSSDGNWKWARVKQQWQSSGSVGSTPRSRVHSTVLVPVAPDPAMPYSLLIIPATDRQPQVPPICWISRLGPYTFVTTYWPNYISYWMVGWSSSGFRTRWLYYSPICNLLISNMNFLNVHRVSAYFRSVWVRVLILSHLHNHITYPWWTVRLRTWLCPVQSSIHCCNSRWCK